MYVPEFPSFRNLTRDDKTLLDGFFQSIQPLISELTFTNLFVWNSSEPVLLSRFEETIMLQRARIRDAKTYLLPPLGRQIITDFIRSIRTQNPNNHLPPLYGLTAEESEMLAKEGWKVTSDRDDWDYVYLVSDLADLPGDKYHSKRNFIRRCLSENDCRYAAIGPQEISDCLQLQTKWCNLRQCGENPSLKGENTAIRTVFENYELLGTTGGAVYVNDKLEAFTVAEPLNKETAVIHFEKANPKIDGLYQVINQWFCQKALKDFRFVNREQDLGLPGLRKAKLSYHPHHMVEKSIVEL
jgi:hypothetical protein